MGERDALRPRLLVWTRDVGRALRVSKAPGSAASGSTTTSRSRPMPHGGYKQSGYGKDLSIYSLEDYTNIKHVMTNLS